MTITIMTRKGRRSTTIVTATIATIRTTMMMMMMIMYRPQLWDRQPSYQRAARIEPKNAGSQSSGGKNNLNSHAHRVTLNPNP